MARVNEPWLSIVARIRVQDAGFDSPCWMWTGNKNEKGYGRSTVPTMGRVRIHRATYEMCIGPIGEGLQLDHLCRNRACVNPAHLEPVTSAENTRRGLQYRIKKGLVPPGCPEERRRRHATYMRAWSALNAERLNARRRERRALRAAGGGR